MKRKKYFIISMLLFLIPLILGAIFYNKLPAKLPGHYDISGNVDRYDSKAMVLFGMPLLLMGVTAFSYIVTNLDPRRKHQGDSVLKIVLIVMPALSIFTSISSILFGLGKNINVSLIMSVLMGLLFIALGNYMPKTKRNYTIGIKTPWTLSSDEIWDRTHRLTGYCFIIGGIGIIFNGLRFGNLYVFFACVFLIVLIPTFYSLYLFKKSENE